MNIFLIGGAPNTGKTNAVVWIANQLIVNGFTLKECINYSYKKIAIPKVATKANSTKDFLAVFEGKNKNGKKINITIASASDTKKIIDKNTSYLKNHPCDLYISSIRDINEEREFVLKQFRNEQIYEFPVAKVSRKEDNWFKSKDWYDESVHNILSLILRNPPFELF